MKEPEQTEATAFLSVSGISNEPFKHIVLSFNFWGLLSDILSPRQIFNVSVTQLTMSVNLELPCKERKSTVRQGAVWNRKQTTKALLWLRKAFSNFSYL